MGNRYPMNAGALGFSTLHYQISKAATALKTMSTAIVMVNLNGRSPTNLTALIASPNYPQQYPEWSTIVWLAKTRPGYKLTLEIYDLDIGECCGNVTLYDGSDRRSTVISVLSGNNSKGTAID